MVARIGVDVGGTFTDVVLWDAGSDTLHIRKVPTRVEDFTGVIGEAVADLLRSVGIASSNVTFLAHGTTIATNQILERDGAKTAVVCTRGFRDVLEIGRLSRPPGYLYDLTCHLPLPLVPRRRRLEISERVDYHGAVVRPLVEEELAGLLDALDEEGAESVAICLLFSYVNAAHEAMIRDFIQSRRPNLFVSASSDIMPEYREYERMATTVLNAYVGPRVARYIERLQGRLAPLTGGARIFVMQSNGGLTSPESVVRRPVTTLFSGPSAGAIAGTTVGASAGFTKIINIDMGGTSFDVSLALNGELVRTNERAIDHTPVKVPMIDIHTIGTGGGSIAWVDEADRFRVGPRSAGAYPGPSCYGRGGDDATVTDASLLLGYLNPKRPLGGTVRLSPGRARSACRRLGKKLGIDALEAAAGIHRIANTAMVGAVRAVSSAQGHDSREFVLVAFGGAGPVHAIELAHEIGCKWVVVPLYPGCNSAMGLLNADTHHDFVRSLVSEWSELSVGELEEIFQHLLREGTDALTQDGVSQHYFERSLDVRYLGQDFSINIGIDNTPMLDDDCSSVQTLFHTRHEQLYGFKNANLPVELVNLRLKAKGLLPKLGLSAKAAGPSHRARPISRRPAYDHRSSGFRDAAIFDRAQLAPGSVIEGPAIVEQEDATTIVAEGYIGVVDVYGNLVIGTEEWHGRA